MQREVLGERELEHEAAPLAVLGDVADARVEALARGLARSSVLAATAIVPRCDRAQAA